MLQVALIGVGGFGYCHLLSIRQLMKDKKIRFVAACDINPAYRTEPEKDGAVFFEHYEDMLRSSLPIDYAVISTPIHTHSEIAIKCLENGIHVLLEKPPAILPEEYEAIMAAQTKSQKICAINYTMTSDPAFQDLCQMIRSGKLGKITKITGIGLGKRPDSYYRSPWIGKLHYQGYVLRDGTINNPFSHILNQLFSLARESGETQIHSVEAELYHARDITGEDTSCARIEMKNGMKLFFYGTLCHEAQEPGRVEVHGTKGNALWQYPCFLESTVAKHPSYLPSENATDLIHENLYHFLTKGTPLFSSLESCRNTVLASDAAFRSAETIAMIPPEYKKIYTENGNSGLAVKNIKGIILAANAGNALYSEANCPWAVTPKKVLL